jgi:predicted amidohydrolase
VRGHFRGGHTDFLHAAFGSLAAVNHDTLTGEGKAMKFGTIIKDGRKVDRDRHVFDVVIRNSWVIDPASDRNGPGTIYIRNGKIVLPLSGEENADAGAIIDAGNCLTTPGLIDSHAHVFETDGEGGTDADLLCIPNGVTTVIDGGSTGCVNFRIFHEKDIVTSVTGVKALMNICANGMISVAYGEYLNPEFYDPDEMCRLFAKHPDVLLGIKVRVDNRHLSAYGFEPICFAREVADRVKATGRSCVVQVHALHLPDGALECIIGLLRKGDIFIHMYNPFEGGIMGADGRVKECVREARKRGVLFDCCGGRVLFSVEVIRKAFDQGFFPDIIATDLVSTSVYRRPMFSLAHALTMYHYLGLPLEAVVRAATFAPALAYNISGICGTLRPGVPADVSVFKLVDANVKCFDAYGGIFKADKVLVPMLTIKDGNIRFRQTWFQDELSL